MSRKKKHKLKPQPQSPNVEPTTAKELSQKLKLQSENYSQYFQNEPTGSLPNQYKRNPNYVDDRSKDLYLGSTQANYKELYEEEKINSVYSQIDTKTNLVEAKLSGEIEKMRTFIESKFSSFTKWGIGIILAVIGIPIGGFYFLLNNQTEKIESKMDLKLEKRISPIENRLENIEKNDSLSKSLNKNMPNKPIKRTP
jgi:hypothetical protein